MKLLCTVDQAECIRHGIDAPSSTIKIEVDPKNLTEEQRNLVADELCDGLRFPQHSLLNICPPTYEGFIAAVKFGLECHKRPNAQTEELKEIHQNFIKSAIEEVQEREAAGPLIAYGRTSFYKE